MIEIAIVAAIPFLLLGWCIVLSECQHKNVTGNANYFDDDRQVFVHLKTCDDCGIQIITAER